MTTSAAPGTANGSNVTASAGSGILWAADGEAQVVITTEAADALSADIIDLSEYSKPYKKWEDRFWFGVDFGEEQDVKCIAIFQKDNNTFVREDIDRWWFRALEVDLQSWLGLADGWGATDLTQDADDPLDSVLNTLLTPDQRGLKDFNANWLQRNHLRFGQLWVDSWNYRPAPYGSIYRLLSPQLSTNSWRLFGKPQYFSDDDCFDEFKNSDVAGAYPEL